MDEYWGVISRISTEIEKIFFVNRGLEIEDVEIELVGFNGN